jgi:uncharacterized protein (TIGR00299 family) protein
VNTLYLDTFSGISGDMFIGAMIDLGVNPSLLEQELAKLNLEGYHLHVARGVRQSIAGTKFDVHLAHQHDHAHSHEDHAHDHDHSHSHPPAADAQRHPHRGFTEIQRIINSSLLSDWVKQKAVAVFRRIAIAEGSIHGIAPEQVHFHEVGAVDSIVDILGACIALEMLGKPKVVAGEVVDGTGTIRCAHGAFPIPAPATLAILSQRKIPVSQCDDPNELITPTGAALLAEFCESFGPMRGFAPAKIGFGLGSRENKTRPNVLRAMLGQCKGGDAPAHDWETDRVAVLETNLDNMNPELLGNVLERAMDKGALDVFHTPVYMKKSRPGVILSIICGEGQADDFTEFLLRETTALGVRRSICERRKLKREFTTVQTEYGEVTLKLGRLDGQVIQRAPEYESCRRLSEKTGVPIKDIYAAALRHG